MPVLQHVHKKCHVHEKDKHRVATRYIWKSKVVFKTMTRYRKHDRVVSKTIHRKNLIWKKKHCGPGCDQVHQVEVVVPIQVESIVTDNLPEKVQVPQTQKWKVAIRTPIPEPPPHCHTYTHWDDHRNGHSMNHNENHAPFSHR